MPESIRILHEPTDGEPFAVIVKPRGLPSAPLHESEDGNAFAAAAALFPCLRTVAGRKPAEHGLLHRLDTATEGLLLVAASQAVYDALQRAQADGLFVKEYMALCQPCGTERLPAGFPPRFLGNGEAPCTVESAFRPYGPGGREVRPVTDAAGRAARKKGGSGLYRTQILEMQPQTDGTVLVRCSLERGFRHQVRCHLAWAGLPIVGDALYGTLGAAFCFSATRIVFPRLQGSGNWSFSLKPDFL